MSAAVTGVYKFRPRHALPYRESWDTYMSKFGPCAHLRKHRLDRPTRRL